MTYDSPLPIDECLDADFGDISNSESERYRNDSRLAGMFCNINPDDGFDASKRFRFDGEPVSSTSKL